MRSMRVVGNARKERKGKEMRVYRVLVLNPDEPGLGFGNPILKEKHFLIIHVWKVDKVG